MEVIRHSSLRPIPWKNGGGITHEMMRVPAAGEPYRWRLSVAHIDVPGPFSNFAGYTRTMVLIKGAGLLLTFGGGNATLNEAGDMVEFDGALATTCELRDGPCVDLNLIVSKTLRGVRAWVERLRESRPVKPSNTTLAFAISGYVSVDAGGESTRLNEWDLAVLSPADRAAVGPAALDESAAPLVFFATLDDNRQ